jgi:hypothetical protein
VRDNNPYVAGAGTNPIALTGRSVDAARFEELVKRLRDGRSARGAIMIGFRGVGKSALLSRFEILADRHACRTVSCELQDDVSCVATLGPMMAKMLKVIGPDEGQLAAIEDALLATSAIFDHQKILRWGGERLDPGLLVYEFSEILVQIGHAARYANTAAVFLFDEMHHASELDLQTLLAGFHRVTQLNLPVALVGAGLPSVQSRVAAAQPYAERLFEFPRIGCLGRQDTEGAFVRPARRLGVGYTEEAIELLVSLSEGYPFYIQEYGAHAWEVARGNPISEDDAKRARWPAEHGLVRDFISMRLARTSNAERDYIYAMARLGRGPYRITQVEQDLKNDLSVDVVRHGLIERAHIYLTGGGTVDFTAPRFGEFVLQRERIG